MKNNNQIRNYILVGLSSSIMMLCLILIKIYGNNLKLIIHLVIALMIFGNSTNNILKLFVLKDGIEEKKQMKIEQNDERNTLIRDKAGAKTNYIMLLINTAITFTLAFKDVNIWIICLFGSLIFIQGMISIFTQIYYSKKY